MDFGLSSKIVMHCLKFNKEFHIFFSLQFNIQYVGKKLLLQKLNKRYTDVVIFLKGTKTLEYILKWNAF